MYKTIRSFSNILKKTLQAHHNYSQGQQHLHGEILSCRSLVKVKGNEAADYLQGLITNDITHLDAHVPSIHAMFLNTKGRMLFDVIIYKYDDGYLLECDNSVSNSLLKHLKMYKVRRKISIEEISDLFKVGVAYNINVDFENMTSEDIESLYKNTKEKYTLPSGLGNIDDSIITRDPRNQYLGYRFIIPQDKKLEDIVAPISKDDYKILRYKLGICEGSEELVMGKYFPLEINCDYLHGVSFHKGCYIGQELVARTFHTGVIRKRLMPLLFSENNEMSLQLDSNIINEKGKSVGKLRAYSGLYGVGLMRIEECLKAGNLTINNLEVKTFKPPWWPIVAPKGK